MTFKNCICFQLGKTQKKITRKYREKISDLDLTHGQFFMLIALYEDDGVLPSVLAEKTCQDRATTTGLIDRLERDGWIERKPSNRDRRTLGIHLSAKAQQFKEEILKIFEGVNSTFTSLFTIEEWQTFMGFLDKLDIVEK
ncbi:MAG: MarR family transcriptional regulator [Desulfobacterales bacterium]|nr:MarR family transcriptional regulator [Desulfobacterales bacterium]MCP4161829.1 MarR family transcriptional regulator [Deltaproteobacteria bacterium]